jgi:hypothetical protein
MGKLISNRPLIPVLILLVLLAALLPADILMAQAVTPFTNEVSFFKNMDDLGRSRGTTLQVISINGFKFGTDFVFEFTGDFNWELDLYEDYDYYIELSLVKPVYKAFSVNYQRIYGTFYDEPVNQFGIRFSLFAN